MSVGGSGCTFLNQVPYATAHSLRAYESLYMYLHIANECFDFLVFQLLTLYALQLKIFFPTPKSLSLLNPNNRNILHKNEHDCLFFQELKFFIVFNNLPKQILIASISSHLWDAICVLILSLRSFSFIFITTNL